MKKANAFLRIVGLFLALVIVVLSFGGCKTTVKTTTSIIEVPVDEDDNIIEDELTADGEIIDGDGNGSEASSGGTKSSGKKEYAAPDGYYNYMKNAGLCIVYYDCKETLSDDKKTVTVTHGGGPAFIGDVFMDPHQSYVIRCKVKINEAKTIARIIFKGNSVWDSMYLSISDNGVEIYDCESGLVPGNNFVAAETRVAKSNKKFSAEVGKEYDTIIFTKPGYCSVWVNGTQYFDNLDLNNGMQTNKYYLVPDYVTKIKETRYINETNLVGFYCYSPTSTAQNANAGTGTFSSIKAYYTVPGMDKNYTDDGKDTNYQSTWKQTHFVFGAFTHGAHSNASNDSTLYGIIKEANCNLILPIGVSLDRMKQVSDVCEAKGLDYLVGVDGVLVGSSMLDKTQLKKVVDTFGNKSHAIGYHVYDEPSVNIIWRIRKMNQYITQYDENAITYSTILPSYSQYSWTTDKTPYNEYVDTYVKKVKQQVLSNDFYPFQEYGINIQMGTNQYYRDLGYIRKAGLKSGSQYWQAISGQQNWETGDIGQMNGPRVALEANVAIAYGCSGVTLFTAQEALATSLVNSGKVTKGKLFNEMKTVIGKSVNAGNTLFGSKSVEIYHSNISASQASLYFANAAPDGKPSSSVLISNMTSSSKSGIVVGVLKKNDKYYIVAANKDYSAVNNVTITLKNNKHVKMLDTNTGNFGAVNDTANLTTSLEAGGIAVWEIG